jgi:YbbR domain-containing protein
MQTRPGVSRFILDNLGWMLSSLAVAVVIWYAAVSAQNPIEQRRFPARLPIQMLKDDSLLVVNNPPDTALVTVRAPRSVWDVLEAEDISVTADLTKLAPGTHKVVLQGILSPSRQGMVTDIQPAEITVELARRFEQLVNIDVIRTAEPPPGLTSSYTLSDKEARIVGPENKVKQVVGAQARISLQDQRTGFSRTVPVIPVDANNKEVLGVTVTPAEVTVTMDIQPRPDVTELSVVARLTGELPPGYLRRNYTWEPKTVGVRGDRATIESMNGLIPTEPIDLTGKTQTFTQGVKLALPPGVTLVEAVDISVTVEIEPILGSREFDNIPVQPQGLDSADYIITIQPDRVNVIVNGPQPVLDTLTASDISVIAPLSGYSAGKNPVTLRASVARPEIKSSDIVIPNARAEVTIVARHPTPTPAPGPTRTPTPTSAATETATSIPS